MPIRRTILFRPTCPTFCQSAEHSPPALSPDPDGPKRLLKKTYDFSPSSALARLAQEKDKESCPIERELDILKSARIAFGRAEPSGLRLSDQLDIHWNPVRIRHDLARIDADWLANTQNPACPTTARLSPPTNTSTLRRCRERNAATSSTWRAPVRNNNV